MKHVWKVLIITLVLTVVVYVVEQRSSDLGLLVTRNDYGSGEKTEQYEVIIEGESKKEIIEFDVEEQIYNYTETQSLFREVMEQLDPVVLGENESFNRVEKDIHLVTSLGDYPVQIQWNLSSYDVIGTDGTIKKDKLSDKGTLVTIRGTISYHEEEAVYVRNMMLFEPERKGLEKIVYEIQKEIQQREENTREEKGFLLPDEIDGKKLQWVHKKDDHWYYVLFMGVVCAVYFVYQERERGKEKQKRRQEELLREYPGMISKFTMLLQTGMTVKKVWEKIVQNYESQKENLGCKVVYEEMLVTGREIQGGVSEMEAYEKFGKRCGNTVYLKFGAMLAQNVRKGSKGIADILRMEAIQSFENRKNKAKRLGEEAGTKLLVPMLGMLLVVLIMVMVPAFFTMQI